ncbi:MAG: trypsin-like peptidase domain-containing protein [Bdellovibrionota bacterium]
MTQGMSPSKGDFACPFCAEKVQSEALHCKHCNHSLYFDVQVQKMPGGGEITGLVHTLLDLLKEDDLQLSYGQLRKDLASGNSSYLSTLSRKSAQRIVDAFENFGGQAQVVVSQISQKTDRKASRPQLNASFGITFYVGLALLGVGAFAFGKFQKMFEAKQALRREAAAQREVFGAVSNVRSENGNAPPSFSKPAIDNMIHSTASVYVGDKTVGSAFFVTDQGHLITNYHVTLDAQTMIVQTHDGKKHDAVLLKTDPKYDLSLIQISSNEYQPLSLGDATVTSQGESVWTVGAPKGLSFSVARGVVSYVGRNMDGRAYIQTDVAINPGNSGGPLMLENGQVIGINTFILKETEGLNFSVPINYVYMGDSPILENVSVTSSDNDVMRQWRAFENQDPAVSMLPRYMAPENSMQNRLAKKNEEKDDLTEWKKINERLKVRNETQIRNTDVVKEKIDGLRADFKQKSETYGDFVGTITQETNLEKEIHQLQKQILDEELRLIHLDIEYFREIEDLYQQILLVAPPSAYSQVKKEIKSTQDKMNQSLEYKAEKEKEREDIEKS